MRWRAGCAGAKRHQLTLAQRQRRLCPVDGLVALGGGFPGGGVALERLVSLFKLRVDLASSVKGLRPAIIPAELLYEKRVVGLGLFKLASQWWLA